MEDPEHPLANPGESRRIYVWWSRHDGLVDGVVAIVLALLVGGLYFGSAGWWTSASQGALVLALAWRRTNPVRAAIGMAAICLAQLAAASQLGLGQVAVLIIIGANAARSSRREARAVLVAALAGVVLLVLRYALIGSLGAGWVPAVVVLVAGWAVVGVAWLAGDVARSRRLEREALAERAVQLERERALDRELVAAEERRHIARELHDVVAHSLAIVVTQADGARYAAAGTPGPAVPALETIAATARTALNDMRGLLGVLRDGLDEEDAALSPAERLEDLPAVLAAVRSTGLEVRMRTEGEPRMVSAGAGLVIHRVVQEALTNVLKHAGPDAIAEVTIRWRPHDVAVSVLDTGRGPDWQQEDPGGHGLRGMRERVAVFGGRLEFGRRDGGGARLLVELPLHDLTQG